MDFDKDGNYASSYNLAGLIQWKLGKQANAKQLQSVSPASPPFGAVLSPATSVLSYETHFLITPL